MKKTAYTLLSICLAVMTLLCAAGCGGKDSSGGNGSGNTPKPGSGGVVNVYNWGGPYIDEDIFKDFENETGIKVNYSEYQSNEEMYSLLRMGGTNVDVIIPSDYMVARLIEENMLEKLDFSNIPNYSLIDGNYKKQSFDPDGAYSVAYMTGTVGLIYNSAMISDDIFSWEALFNSKYKGDILMFNNPRDAFGIALKYLGYSQNTTSEAEIREAYALLQQQKPLLQAYVMDQIYDKLEAGEAALGPYYAGDFLVMRENNSDLVFIRPVEGSNAFIDAMCIPKGASNKTNAELFINFMCSTDACLANMEVTGYASANSEAADLYGADMNLGDFEIMFASTISLSNCDVFTNLPPEILALYDQLWVELKS